MSRFKRWAPGAIVLGTALLVATPTFATPLSFRLTLPASDVTVRTTANGPVVDVAQSGFSRLAEAGQPEIPYRIVGVLLPQGQDVSTFRVDIAGDQIVRRGVRLPGAAPVATEDGVVAASTGLATAGTSFPEERVRFLGVGTLHGYSIASFAIFPLQLRDGDLVATETMTLEIETAPSSRAAPAMMERRRDDVRARARSELASVVINPGDADGYVFPSVVSPPSPGGFQPTTFPSLEGSPVDYVIVTPDSLAAAYQTLADYKTRKGVPTVVRTIEWILANYRHGSDTQETIRNFVIDAYAKWGITYLLLGGDTDQVPVRLAYSAFYEGGKLLPVDMYYGCLDGDWNGDHDALFGEATPQDSPDLYAEVYVGRLPTSSVAEVNMMTNKIISYETPVDVSFGHRILMLSEVLFPIGWQPPQTITLNGADLTELIYNNDMSAPGLDVVRMYETEEFFPGSVDEKRVPAIDSLNTGFNHVIHLGHGFRFNMSVGDASIVNSDADALTNGNRLSCLYFLNCTGAAYTYYCLAEHYMRNPNGGAVTVIGANDSAFPNTSSAYMNTYYDLVFNQGVVHIGEAFARSRLPRTPLASLGDNVDLWTHYIYTLLADPELPMWTGRPAVLSVTHAPSVSVGANSIAITVNSGGNPVQGAKVCLSKGDEDYAVGTTNASGQVTLAFRPKTAGTIDVVVTGTNYRYNASTITVTTGGAYVRVASTTVDDDNAGGTNGNGNGVIDGGETVDMTLSLTNTGTVSTGAVTLVLRSTDPGVTIIDSTASVPVMSSGQTLAATDPVRASFGATLADAHAVPFTVIIKNNGIETWRDTFKRQVYQPKLSLVKLRIDDTGTGNGNGIVEAGESFKLFYQVKNFGTGAYPGGTVAVTDVDGAFTIVNSTDTLPAIPSLVQSENTAGLSMSEASVATEHRLGLTITDLYGRAFVDTVELRPPLPPSALLVDPSFGPTRLEVTWTKSSSPDVAHYNVYRSLSSGGPFTLANTDPVAHTLFVNEGLSASTVYYFRATAVDASGNESAMSATSSGSTNPEQLAGWPIDLAAETASSVAVGDIDGDGEPEIVACADKVYAWHANGIEVLDGDGNPQSWGVLSSVGNSFVSHPALAQMDHVPGLDIVAASHDLKLVYVFNYQGQVLPGWPKATINSVRGGIAVGDLDGDNLPEVTCVDELGKIYAWHADGSEFIDGDSNPLTDGVFYTMAGNTFAYTTPAIADIDGDNINELIVGSQASQLFVFKQNGSIATGFPYALGASIAGSPVVADVDNNGDMEILVNETVGGFKAINHDGTLLFSQFFSNNPWNNFFQTTPAVGNVTGDAKLEIFVARANGNIYGMQSNGVVLAGWPKQYSATTYTESSPIIGDIDGDGILDIVLGDETQYIHAWNASGTPIAGFPLKTADAMRGVPTITDVDGDGDVDLVAAGWDKNVYVWDFAGAWDPNKAPWPRFHGNLHNNGRYGYTVPTPVRGATFRYTAGGRGVELVWGVPPEAGRVFTVTRAEVVNGAPGSFVRVASGVSLGTDGLLRVTDGKVEMGSRYVYRLEGESGLVDETLAVVVPVSMAKLGQNYPNPFNPTTTIEYWVPGGSGKTAVSVVIYDVRGARVRTLVEGAEPAGRYTATWDGRTDAGAPASSGIYFYRMTAPGFADVRKMVLLK